MRKQDFKRRVIDSLYADGTWKEYFDRMFDNIPDSLLQEYLSGDESFDASPYGLLSQKTKELIRKQSSATCLQSEFQVDRASVLRNGGNQNLTSLIRKRVDLSMLGDIETPTEVWNILNATPQALKFRAYIKVNFPYQSGNYVFNDLSIITDQIFPPSIAGGIFYILFYKNGTPLCESARIEDVNGGVLHIERAERTIPQGMHDIIVIPAYVTSHETSVLEANSNFPDDVLKQRLSDQIPVGSSIMFSEFE